MKNRSRVATLWSICYYIYAAGRAQLTIIEKETYILPMRRRIFTNEWAREMRYGRHLKSELAPYQSRRRPQHNCT